MLAAFSVQATMSLGPAAFTYSELAASLTKAGMPTEASPVLRSRAAYVSIRGRTPEAARRLLGEALGVAFQAQNGGWLMVADPVVKDRDRRFLTAYRKIAAVNAPALVAGPLRMRGSEPYAQFLADVRGRIADLETKAQPDDDAIREAYLRMWMVQPNFWNGLNALSAPELLSSIDGPRTRRVPFGRMGIPASSFTSKLIDGNPASLAAQTPFDQTFRFDPRRGTFSVMTEMPSVRPFERTGRVSMTLHTAKREYYAGLTGEMPFELPAETGTVEETFGAMGPEAAQYFAGLPRAELPDLPRLDGDAPTTLGEALERYGEREVVMELSPRFETTAWDGPRPIVETFSLRSLFARRPTTQPSLMKSMISPKLSGLDLVRENGRLSERSWPWRPVEREGVLLAINPFGFLDRAQPIPAAPYLRVGRILAQLRPGEVHRALTWKMAVALVAAARPELELSRMGGTYRNPYGIPYPPLQPMVESVQALSAQDRAQFWATLRETGEAKVRSQGGVLVVQAGSMTNSLYTLIVRHLDTEGAVTSVAVVEFDGRGSIVP